MPAYLRYDIKTATATQPFVFSFHSEQALKAHLDNHMPAEARNVDMFWMDESPRQAPTYLQESTPSPFKAWKEETGREPAVTCPIEVVPAKAAPRRIHWGEHEVRSSRIGSGAVTGYTATQKAKTAG